MVVVHVRGSNTHGGTDWQDIKLAQMTQKMGELEMRMQQELAAVWALKVLREASLVQ